MAENVYYYDANGEFQYGPRPSNLWYDDSVGGMREGAHPGFEYGGPSGGSTLPGGGGGVGVIPPGGGGGGPNPYQPDPPSLPTPPLGGVGNPPQPGGGPVAPWTGEGRQADTSWDWDAFAPKRQGDAAWGGFDKDYGAYERYQPGMESPWGMPDVQGGNKEFYQQQFANLLRDEQGYQNRERQSQEARQFAQDNPLDRQPTDWSWANAGKGIDPAVASTGPTQGVAPTWGLNPNLNADMSNADMVSGLSSVLSDDDIFGLGKHQDYIDSGDFSSRESVNDWVTNNPYRNDKKWSSALGQVGQNIYTPQGGVPGSNIPIGYAAPI